jgi:hypothetical protein
MDTFGLGRVLATGVINQDLAHQPGGHAEKVSPVLPGYFGFVDQSQIRLVNQGCGLKRMTGPLATKTVVSQPAQLVINQRDEFVQRRLIATAPLQEQPGDIFWRGRCHTLSGTNFRKLWPPPEILAPWLRRVNLRWSAVTVNVAFGASGDLQTHGSHAIMLLPA